MKIIQAPVKPPASETISNELSRLVLWLLQKDPMLRPSTKDILNEVSWNRSTQLLTKEVYGNFNNLNDFYI
jgi:serine/threonine protein kinase